MINDFLSFIPLGGIGDVTKNLYVYEYKNSILIVDCGIGFADETMLGVDLLLPDISYLLQTNKKIVGMALTHGHEDHIGALPFILPQLSHQVFPIYATPLTSAFANAKLKEFGMKPKVQTVNFSHNEQIVGPFKLSFIRVTHSVPDTSHIFIETPVGNFYHGSDFKFDLTPFDGNKTDFAQIAKKQEKGIRCLLSDCLGAEREGFTPSETNIGDHFDREIRNCIGKVIITTYSSNIARLNQAIQAAKKNKRKVCFLGRSLIKTKEISKLLKYLHLDDIHEVDLDHIKKYPDNEMVFIVAGSQGQENSAMARIANGEHKDIKLKPADLVIFSADPIPGNEVLVYSLVDSIAKTGAKTLYSDISHDFHVSGHGSSDDLLLLMSLTKPKTLLPISGTYRHMTAYRDLALKFGYKQDDVLLLEDGQEILFFRDTIKAGRRIDTRNVYVDQISGEEVEGFVLRDRQKLSEAGIIIVVVEINSATSQIDATPDIIARGFSTVEVQELNRFLMGELQTLLSANKGRVTNWVYLRKLVGDTVERKIFKELKRRPLVLPVVIEV